MATKSDDIRARLLSIFRVEAEEHLQAITANLLALDRGLPPAEVRQVVEATFRAVHTLKGAARSVSLMDAEALCQALESILSRITRGHLAVTRPILNYLHEGVDGLARVLGGGETSTVVRELISRLDRATSEPVAEVSEPAHPPHSVQPQPQPAEAPPAEAPAAPVASGLLPEETIRVSAAKLDAVFLQAEQLLLPKLYLAQAVRDTKEIVDALSRCRGELDRAWATSSRLSHRNGHGETLPANVDSELRGLESQARQFHQTLVRRSQAASRAVDGLQEEMRSLRLMPASTILDFFPRMVRDLARQQGKDVEWLVQGATLEVDRRVLEGIKDPLIHLVRNAIDHGIEAPAVRTQAGKSPKGKVGVSVASLEGGRVEIRVADDGGGIDLARLRAAAVRARVLTPEAAESLPDEAALELMYRSGVSTNPVITDVSGHGLGLAIVKERIERLKDEIHVETRSGAGTTVRMILPATIATFHGLLVRAGGQMFLIPTEAIERAIRIRRSEVESVEGREAIRWDGRPLPAAKLSALVGIPEREEKIEAGSHQFCVVIRSAEEQLGLLVEEVVGDREVLVRELPPPLVRVRHIAAAGFLGIGQIVMILRPTDLFKPVHRTPRATVARPAPEDRGRQPSILVVDDSITTRTMEKNLLEAAGFQVRVAVDGVEAWTLLKSESFDLVLSDVDMPRMDGFELTARIRADRKLGDLPVVLVTAMESRENKERGIEMGANAYIIKSSFDQSNLLEIIRRLV